MKIITPEQFGAVADGITNDFYAVSLALAEAMVGDCTVEFAADKTYYLGYDSRVEALAAFALHDCKNVTLRGCRTRILIDRPLYYTEIVHTENTVLEGFIFDYRVRPFALGTVLERNDEALTAVVQADRSLQIDRETDTEFAVLQRDDGRYHLFLRGVEPLEGENRYRFYFRDVADTRRFLKMTDTYPVILPLPGFAHRIERAFSITDNTDFTMRHCRVWSMARFGFAILRNYGTLLFDDLRVEQAPGEPCKIVGWRDCFHVKENHAKCLWYRCYAEYCYDDIFNISASTLYVQEVLSETELDFRWRETGGTYPCVEKGDTFSIVDTETGRDYGTAVVREVVRQEDGHNVIRFCTPFRGVSAGENIFAFDLDNVAPGSIIEDCDFRGTFRFRGPIEIRHSDLYVARMWIDMYERLEGPVPRDVCFRDCTLTCDDEENPYFHIVAQKKSVQTEQPYHLENIVFEHCRLPVKTLEIDPLDKPYVRLP